MEENLTIGSKPLRAYGLKPRRFFVSKFFQALLIIAFGVFWTVISVKFNAPKFVPVIGGVFVVIGIGTFLFTSRYYRLMKNGKRIKRGMHIDQVREILKPFRIENAGYDSGNQYCVYYKENAIFGKDYEGVYISFYDNKVVGVSFSYHRTSVTYR